VRSRCRSPPTASAANSAKYFTSPAEPVPTQPGLVVFSSSSRADSIVSTRGSKSAQISGALTALTHCRASPRRIISTWSAEVGLR